MKTIMPKIIRRQQKNNNDTAVTFSCITTGSAMGIHYMVSGVKKNKRKAVSKGKLKVLQRQRWQNKENT